MAETSSTGYNSHHLSMEECWYVRENPFKLRVARVKALIVQLDAAELVVEELQAKLDAEVKLMRPKAPIRK